MQQNPKQSFKKLYFRFLSICLIAIIVSFGVITNLLLSFFDDEEKPVEVKAESKEDVTSQISDMNIKINSYQSLISSLSQKEKTLEEEKSDVDSALKELTLKKNNAKAEVDGNLKKIQEIQTKINEYTGKEDTLKAQLASVIRIIHASQNETSIEILLGEERLSSALNRMENVSTIQKNLDEIIVQTRVLKLEQKEAQKVLASKQEELDVLYRTIAEEENEAKSLAAYKKSLIDQANASQRVYESKLAHAQSLKDELTSELALLSGGGKITFELAVGVAKKVEGHTGVRAALLLGVLKQETNFGSNVGTATYHTAYKGSSASKRIKYFKQITNELGMDPETTKVSAWPGYGSGGAMGPCQFMPDTWMGYRDAIKKATGTSIPNPWDLEDCLTGMGIKLKKAGAASQKYNDEWQAVAMYFAGGNWNNPRFSFYPNNIMSLAAAYEKQIN